MLTVPRTYRWDLHRQLTMLAPPMSLLLVVLLLLQLLPASPPRPWVEPAAPAPILARPAPPQAPAYPLPAALIGRPELPELRTATSATFAMGDGTYAVVQELDPLHYLAADGAWQPINPAFAELSGGWLNETNSLQTGLAERGGVAKLTAGQAGVAWEPQELRVSEPAGAFAVAVPLPAHSAEPGARSPTGERVRYPHSWSMPGLQEQWAAGFGQSEYSMLLPERPGLGHLSAPELLELRVRLSLLPGTTIHHNGAPAVLPFESDGTIGFLGPDGALLSLEPPYAFERGRFEAGVAGSYALVGTDDPQVVELLVRLPWAWFAAPERAYPVVIDPRFIVREPATYGNIRTTYDPLRNTPGASEFVLSKDRTQAKYAVRRVGFWQEAGTYKRYRDDLAVLMPIPVLPSGAEVSEAYFSAIPSNVNNHDATLGDPKEKDEHHYGLNTIDLFALQSDAWHRIGGIPQVGAQIPSMGQGLMVYNGDSAVQGAVDWDVTTQVRAWSPRYTGEHPNVPFFNPGLLLRPRSDQCALNSCRAFYFNADSWGDDELWHTWKNADPQANTTAVRGSRNGGLRLTVFYSTPTLTPGGRISVISPADPTRAHNYLPPAGIRPYYEAYHTYRVEGMSQERWYAMVARGYGPQARVENPDNTVRITQPVSGALQLRLTGPGAPETANRPFSTSPGKGEVSYMLFNGRSASAQLRQPRWLDLGKGLPNDPTGKSDDGRANGYELRLVNELASIKTDSRFAAERFKVRSLSMPSSLPLALYNLDLYPTSNSLVTVRIKDTTPPIDYKDLAKYLKFEIVLPNQITVDNLETGMPSSGGSGNMPILGSTTLRRSAPFTPGLGPRALVITYNGPRTFTNELPPPPELIGDGGAGAASPDSLDQPEGAAPDQADLPELRFNIDIEVLSCPSGSFPAGDNACQKIECPASVAAPPPARLIGGAWLWSNAGWVQSGNTWRSDITDPEAQPAPMIGRPNSLYPGVAVVGGVIEYPSSATASSANGLVVRPITGGLGEVYLVDCGESPMSYFSAYRGPMQHATRAGAFALAPSGAGQRLSDPWRAEDLADLSNLDFTVRPFGALASDQDAGRAAGTALLSRLIHPDSGGSPATFRFGATWSFGVNGWLDLQHSASRNLANPQTSTIGSLTLTPGSGGYSLDLAPLPPGYGAAHKAVPRLFQSVRAAAGTITAPAELGGASKPIQALFMPRGVAPDLNMPLCPASCLDLRATDDTFTSPNRVWEMPDVRTTGQAGMLAMSREGETLVFSADHPNATLQDFEQDFSFEAHKASVRVARERCVDNPQSPGYVENAPIVTVIQGEARIALPNIGSSGDQGSLIAASFKLCSSTLRSVRMEFASPVGIPIGATGMFLTGLRGGVDIFPDYTQIQVGVTFQAAQGGDGGLFTAKGDVLIDSRGLFEFQGSAKILGTVNAEGAIWVAWSPLDVGFDVSISVGSWLEGRAYAHMWRGQGWGNKYPWLPDNNALHFAGMISAKIYIPAGAIVDIWELKLPPSRVELLGIELAFGEFCINPSCTQYEWGIKGTFSILGYDVGLYYGFEEGLDFILGNDDHILIDQYGNGSLVAEQLRAGARDGLRVLSAPPVTQGVATQPLVIRPEVEQVLVGLTWLSGSLQLTMVRPDGVEITPQNAAQHGAMFDVRPQAVVLTLRDPMAGAWQAKLSGLGEAGTERYTFVYFANRGAPGAADAGLQAAGDRLQIQSAPGGRYRISWPVPADVKDRHTIGLYYRRTEVISGTLHQGVPIRKNLPYRDGSYLWDPSGLLNGNYQVYAVVDDGSNELPAAQISIPNDTCIPLHGPFPRARAFEAARFPGTDIFTATTTVTINDTTAPPAPQGLMLLPDSGGILARWAKAGDADTSQYRVSWGPQSGGSFLPQGSQLLAASDSPQLRIGGLDANTTYGVAIQAVDANGNLSAAAPTLFANAGAPGAPVPLAPTGLQRSGGGSTSLSLSWAPAAGPPASGYSLTYTRLDVRPEVVATTTVAGASATLGGLATGGTYEIVVRARNAQGWESAPTSPLRLVASSGADTNGDGLPDDWANVFVVSGAGNDPDGDGLSNAEEHSHGTSPASFDSDDDGTGDKEEIVAGTDPLRNTNPDSVFVYPRLAIDEEVVSFMVRPTSQAATEAMALPPAQSVAYRNVGGGTMAIKATADAPWLSARVVGDKVEVSLKPAGLTPGFHSTVVRLTNDGGDPLGSAPQCLRVKAWVYPDLSQAPRRQLYLPIIVR